ncbi:MAG: 5'-nucleotidase C-terminal domain-containing protein [Candidatus Acidiferrales bacterium]|jgi:2',3'-cyclic-nucleotide 2'-phosphodiesterase/3'-nucleotidase
MRNRGMFLKWVLFAVVACVGPSAYSQQGGAQAAPKAATSSKPMHAGPSAVTITLLSTTDSHGHLAAWDYYADKAVPNGLTKMATLVKEQRAEAPHALLFDCGDTTQGTPLVYYFAKKDAAKPNPAIAAFNAMHYDAMAVGNHEFNFGLDSMWKAKRESHFPWLAANLKEIYTAGTAYIPPFVIRNVDGVRVGIIGFITPGVPRWEIPDHYRGYEFESIVETAKKIVPVVRRKADLVVVIMHSGLDRDPKTGEAYGSLDIRDENAAWELADDVPDIDMIFYGHTHQEMPELMIHGVLLSQAKNWGGSLARADIKMQRDAAGTWKIVSKHSRTIAATESVAEDSAIARIVAPYHQATEKYLDTPIATSAKALDGLTARYIDNPLVDLIHRVQLDAGHADVSMATMFFPGVKIPEGPVTVRQLAALYVYENTLYTVEMTGAQLKDALEHAASFYSGWPLAEGQKEKLPGYNADSAEGVSYVIDLAQPVGERIRNLAYKGAALDPGRKLRVAINNYRYTGGGGYSVYKDLPIFERSSDEIRELIIDYLARTKTIPTEADGNWKIEPREALDAILKAAQEESAERSTR